MKSPVTTLRDTPFANLRFAKLGIELMQVSEFKRRTHARQRATPERVDFYMIWLTTRGRTHHSVDFVDFAIEEGSLVFVKPSQVQQWHVEANLEGWIVLVEGTALLPEINHLLSREWFLGFIEACPVVTQLDIPFRKEMVDQMKSLQNDFNLYDESSLDNALIQNAVLGLLLRLARWHQRQLGMSGSNPANPVVFQLFRKALEATYWKQWRVSQFAKHLGYSESTLNRACEAATGQTAKCLIDRRLALEAARLLIHTDASIAEISHRMGFSEPTNFVRFFSRMYGLTPARFRSNKLGGAL